MTSHSGGTTYLQDLPEKIDVIGDDFEWRLVIFDQPLQAKEYFVSPLHSTDNMGHGVPRV
jgi:hypothetical protein